MAKPKIAFIHRYGLEGWFCCGGHAIQPLIEMMSETHELHFYGPRSNEACNSQIRKKIICHTLPFLWNRANPTHKISKTVLWYLWMPWFALHARFTGVQLIWNDETIPFTASLLRLFFGRKIALTVMDFFARIYTEDKPGLYWMRNLVERIDFNSWKKIDCLFTKVDYTQQFLATKGVPLAIMHTYRNPVDHTIFHPIDEATRNATRKKMGYTEKDLVLSHHGILHPNKGNDWILARIAELKNELPNLKFLLIGNGPELDSLQQLAEQLKISDRVQFTGWLKTEADLNNALASADIGLVMRMGQETDHFHMTDTLVHEMACGKPILAVNLHGITEIIKNGENGYTFSPEHPSVFNNHLKTLAATPSHLGDQALALSQQICTTTSISSQLSFQLISL